MIKAYIKDGSITLSVKEKEIITFVAGAVFTTIGEKNRSENPYTLFKDYKETAMVKAVQNELDNLYSLDQNLSPAKKIALLDSDRNEKLYTENTFESSIEIIDGNATFVVYLNTAKDLFALEMLTVLGTKKPLKKCENCGGYFFPSGRSDALYCARTDKTGYSCKKIGAHRQYRKNSQEDSVKKLYDKVTKHNRYLKTKGAISERAYNDWLREASSMYADFKNGSISENTLSAWLLSDSGTVRSAQRTRRNEISDYLL